MHLENTAETSSNSESEHALTDKLEKCNSGTLELL